MIIIGIALLQSGSWVIRKLFTKENKIKKNTIIMAESIIISLFLFGYIFYKTPPQQLLNDFKKITYKQYFYLMITAICVVSTLILIFDLIPKLDMSTLGPSISIIRIVLLTIIGFIMFNEKITMRKIISLIFMITGIAMLVNAN